MNYEERMDRRERAHQAAKLLVDQAIDVIINTACRRVYAKLRTFDPQRMSNAIMAQTTPRALGLLIGGHTVPGGGFDAGLTEQLEAIGAQAAERYLNDHPTGETPHA